MMQSDSLPPTQPGRAPSDFPPSGVDRSDLLALAFLAGCVLLTVPLVFAARLPRALLTIVLLALAALFIARAVMTRSVLPRTAVDWPNILLLLLLPVGLWASTDRAVSWPVIYKVVAGFVVFYGLAGLAGSRWTRALPSLVLVASAALALVVLLGTNWTTAKLPYLPDALYQVLPTLRLPWRPEGIHPNLSGGAMAWLLLPAVALAAWSQKRRLQVLAGVTALLLALALLFSQSRGAWLGAASALLVMPALRYRRWWVVLIIGLAVAVAAALVIGPDRLQSLFFPVTTAEESTVNTLPGRLELWNRALYVLRDTGLAGVGPGQFEQVVLVLYPPFFTGLLGGFQHAHNLYLQAAVDFGIGGLVALVALLLGVGASSIAAARRWPTVAAVDAPLAALAAGIFGSLWVYAIHGLVDALQVAPRGYVLIFALFGAAAAVSSQLLARSPVDAPSEPAA